MKKVELPEGVTSTPQLRAWALSYAERALRTVGPAATHWAARLRLREMAAKQLMKRHRYLRGVPKSDRLTEPE